MGYKNIIHIIVFDRIYGGLYLLYQRKIRTENYFRVELNFKPFFFITILINVLITSYE